MFVNYNHFFLLLPVVIFVSILSKTPIILLISPLYNTHICTVRFVNNFKYLFFIFIFVCKLFVRIRCPLVIHASMQTRKRTTVYAYEKEWCSFLYSFALLSFRLSNASTTICFSCASFLSIETIIKSLLELNVVSVMVLSSEKDVTVYFVLFLLLLFSVVPILRLGQRFEPVYR